MTRTPQPMRRMRYLIGEYQHATQDGSSVLCEAQAWLGGEKTKTRLAINITRDADDWYLAIKQGAFAAENVFKISLLTAPGPETVWIGPDLLPVIIQPHRQKKPETNDTIDA